MKRHYKTLFLSIISLFFSQQIFAQSSRTVPENKIQELVHELAINESKIIEKKGELTKIKSQIRTDSTAIINWEEMKGLYPDSTNLTKLIKEKSAIIAQATKALGKLQKEISELSSSRNVNRTTLINHIDSSTIVGETNSQFDFKKKNEELLIQLQNLQEENERIQNENKSLRMKVANVESDVQQLSHQNAQQIESNERKSEYILNYGCALLFRKYTSRAEDISRWIESVSSEAKKKDIQTLMQEARTMIQSSNVSQDLRDKVWDMVAPYIQDSDASMKDLREVFSKLNPDKQYEYSLTKHALSFFEEVSKSVTDADNRYDKVHQLLLRYKDDNAELLSVLQGIQIDDANSDSRMSAENKVEFIRRIKNTKYYKECYSDPWHIPYLNNVIDEALSLINKSPANRRIDLSRIYSKLQ